MGHTLDIFSTCKSKSWAPVALLSSAASSAMRLASSCAVANAFTTCAVGTFQADGLLACWTKSAVLKFRRLPVVTTSICFWVLAYVRVDGGSAHLQHMLCALYIKHASLRLCVDEDWADAEVGTFDTLAFYSLR